MNKEFIIILVGFVLTITIYGSIIGLPMILIGAYLLNKKANENNSEEVINEINAKKEEIENLNSQMETIKKEKEAQIDKELSEKQMKLDNIDEELDRLEKERIDEVDLKIKDKITELENLDAKYEKLTQEKEKKLDEQIQRKKELNEGLKYQLETLEKEIVHAKDEIEMQEYGLYEPKYKFIDSVSYKERLDSVRKQQKQMIKDKTAAVGSNTWTVDGDRRKGQKMINDNIKQILRNFNIECENVISKVKHSNLENSRKRIQKSYEQLNKLNQSMSVHITPSYLNLKLDELQLAYEYELKLQEEKELLAEAREREREEKRLKKELEKEKNKFNKENAQINKEIEDIKAKMTAAAESEKAKLEAEIAKLQAALDKNNEEIKKIDEWKEKPGAGYVYIISNIGSFGEDVFKIGVTRRDNPEDRVRELSSASVPFKYDSHVFIFSKDAYGLENELHERFDKQRVNKINRRKEFFHMSLDDVKQIVEENKGAVHSFVEKAEAEEYYDTLKIEKRLNEN